MSQSEQILPIDAVAPNADVSRDGTFAGVPFPSLPLHFTHAISTPFRA